MLPLLLQEMVKSLLAPHGRPDPKITGGDYLVGVAAYVPKPSRRREPTPPHHKRARRRQVLPHRAAGRHGMHARAREERRLADCGQAGELRRGRDDPSDRRHLPLDAQRLTGRARRQPQAGARDRVDPGDALRAAVQEPEALRAAMKGMMFFWCTFQARAESTHPRNPLACSPRGTGPQELARREFLSYHGACALHMVSPLSETECLTLS